MTATTFEFLSPPEAQVGRIAWQARPPGHGLGNISQGVVGLGFHISRKLCDLLRYQSPFPYFVVSVQSGRSGCVWCQRIYAYSERDCHQYDDMARWLAFKAFESASKRLVMRGLR